MKVGTKIQVKESAAYNGQDMAWTETYTGQVVLDKATKFMHSSDRPIKSFRAKETCFSTEDILDNCLSLSNKEAREQFGTGKVMSKKYCYVLELPAGTVVDTFSNDEIRVELEEGMELTYIGYYAKLFLDTPVAQKVTDPRMDRYKRVHDQYFLSL